MHMRTATLVLQNLIRVLGVLLIILGILFWTRLDYTEALVQLHMQLGVVLVIALWILAGIALRAHLRLSLIIRSALWGFVVAAFGMSLRRLLGTGSNAELYRVVHLILGLYAISLAEILAAGIKRSLRPAL